MDLFENFGLIDKYYAEMKKIYPQFKTNEREHMLIVKAIDLVVKEAK